MRQMEAEGVTFQPGVEVGAGVSVAMLLKDYDALVMSAAPNCRAIWRSKGARSTASTSRWTS